MEFKFDKMEVDTTLAKEYLEKNSLDDCSLPELLKHEKKFEEIISNYANRVDDDKRLSDLAVKLKDNSDLFVQLEYLLREIPVEDTKAQINLIIQQLNYISHSVSSAKKIKSDLMNQFVQSDIGNEIIMLKDSPLLLFGYVAKMRASRHGFVIRAERVTLPIALLFSELCMDAGFPVKISVASLATSYSSKLGDEGIPEGTLGIITEHSDIDSAVDVFLNSSKKAPWRLQRVLVQENISQQFKDALKWKCNLQGLSDALEYNGRVFLIDQIGLKDPEPTEVYVDTYRTTKELLSLLENYPSGYLSLWANNIEEINEITYNVQTPMVWVNNYAEFSGPAKITEVLYPHPVFDKCVMLKKLSKLNALSKLRMSWLKLSAAKRKDVICKILGDSVVYSSIKYLDCTNGSYVYVCKDYVCTSITTASKNLFFIEKGKEALLTVELFELVILGNGFALCLEESNDNFKEIMARFTDASVPIVFLEKTDCIPDKESGIPIYKCTVDDLYDVGRTTRIIKTNSGTIFSN